MAVGLNSCLYECVVSHRRKSPKEHAFNYRLFMFYIDLDELHLLAKRLRFVRHNIPWLYSFYDSDHLPLGDSSVKANVIAFLRQNGIEWAGERIMLLTHLRVFGYVFNPVSFYFGMDAGGCPCWSIAEVGNTFGEMKPYLVPLQESKYGKRFHLVAPKYFYVSPFMDLDSDFAFKFALPDDFLKLFVNTRKDGRNILTSSLIGFRRQLNDSELTKLSLKYPLQTLRVIFLIHWHALSLYLKKIPFRAKEAHPELQVDHFQAASIRAGEKH